jgi:hypothetical protein
MRKMGRFGTVILTPQGKQRSHFNQENKQERKINVTERLKQKGQK